MCVFKKSKDRPIPKSLVRHSGTHLLGVEVNRLSPLCILVLGSNALRGLRRFEPFKSRLKEIETVIDREKNAPIKPIVLKDNVVVLTAFPNDDWNRRDMQNIQQSFNEAVRIADASRELNE